MRLKDRLDKQGTTEIKLGKCDRYVFIERNYWDFNENKMIGNLYLTELMDCEGNSYGNIDNTLTDDTEWDDVLDNIDTADVYETLPKAWKSKMTDEQKSKVLELYNLLTYDEEWDNSSSELPEDGIIHLEYTEYGFNDDEDDREHQIQVNFDLNTMSYKSYIDDKLVLEQESDIETFIQDLECGGEMGGFLHDCLMKGYEIYGKEEE